MENQTVSSEACCVVSCERPLDQTYWNNQYLADATGWDLGEVSPPLQSYIDQLTDKHLRILIPGCGNTYEAEYLLQQGFDQITVIDISPKLVENLQEKFSGRTGIQIIEGDFFEHQGTYDLILEQTFFCAIPPSRRKEYAEKMHALLLPGGRLVGLLFDREFEHQGPPFGGCKCQYESIFDPYFEFHTFEKAHNSFHKRAGTELFINLVNKSSLQM
jgi:SAM-dependent methyltransferase